ncbi:MAG: HAD family hydrolase [Mastigocoleus sp.]|mgnify:CR=1 FL=1
MLKAILFDLDGTIVNTDPIHLTVWQEVLRPYNVLINEKIYKSKFTGRLNPEIIKDFVPELSSQESEKLAEGKEALFRKQASNLQPLAGFNELIDWTDHHKVKRALVTNAPRLNAEFMLECLNIKQLFDVIILAEEEAAAKPDPIPYKVGLERIRAIAKNSIAIEDSPSGIRSAVNAGIPTIGMCTSQEADTLLDIGAFIAIQDFTDSRLWTFLESQIS